MWFVIHFCQTVCFAALYKNGDCANTSQAFSDCYLVSDSWRSICTGHGNVMAMSRWIIETMVECWAKEMWETNKVCLSANASISVLKFTRTLGTAWAEFGWIKPHKDLAVSLFSFFLERPRRRWQDITKSDRNEVGWESVDWILPAWLGNSGWLVWRWQWTFWFLEMLMISLLAKKLRFSNMSAQWR
jgi:hypothetical protein